VAALGLTCLLVAGGGREPASGGDFSSSGNGLGMEEEEQAPP